MSMQNDVSKEIHVRLFGAFRELAPSGRMTLSVRGGESVGEIKALLATKLRPSAKAGFDLDDLLAKSALAANSKVLGEADQVEGGELAVLPPVCGG